MDLAFRLGQFSTIFCNTLFHSFEQLNANTREDSVEVVAMELFWECVGPLIP